MTRAYVTSDGMTAQKAYDSINKWWFGNKLPKVKIRWPKYMLSEKLRCCSGVWLRTLFHEIVHIEQWSLPAKDAHGPKFEKRMKQLAVAGAFNGLW